MTSKSTRNWLDLPSDLMLNILQRLGVIDRLQNAQKVCTAWREICKDPAMWRVIYMYMSIFSLRRFVYQEMCKIAVDRSQGQLLDLTIIGFCNPELLQYVADRSSQLRRLEVTCYCGDEDGIGSEVFKKLSLLEELILVRTKVRQEHIEILGRYCPLLKTFKLNYESPMLFWRIFLNSENVITIAIGKNLPGLTCLELGGSDLSNTGLEAILDGCCHLESLDLSQCFYYELPVDPHGDLMKRCLQRIKYVKIHIDDDSDTSSYEW